MNNKETKFYLSIGDTCSFCGYKHFNKGLRPFQNGLTSTEYICDGIFIINDISYAEEFNNYDYIKIDLYFSPTIKAKRFIIYHIWVKKSTYAKLIKSARYLLVEKKQCKV